jgi:hypothetical protein
MKRHRTKLFAAALGGFVIMAAASTAAVALAYAPSSPTETTESVSAPQPSPEEIVARDLQSVGVDVKSVSFNVANGSVEVVIFEGSGDAWAITVVPLELSYLAQSMTIPAATLNITIVNDQGEVNYQSFDDPIVPATRPATAGVDPNALGAAPTALDPIAQQKGIQINTIQASDSELGVVVEAHFVITALSGGARDSQLSCVVSDLLPALRHYAEVTKSLGASLYRLTMSDPTGKTIVDYVVDPARRMVNSWSPGIQPVWGTMSVPIPAPAGATTSKP